MSKSRDKQKKTDKKQAQKSLKEKRAAKPGEEGGAGSVDLVRICEEPMRQPTSAEAGGEKIG